MMEVEKARVFYLMWPLNQPVLCLSYWRDIVLAITVVCLSCMYCDVIRHCELDDNTCLSNTKDDFLLSHKEMLSKLNIKNNKSILQRKVKQTTSWQFGTFSCTPSFRCRPFFWLCFRYLCHNLLKVLVRNDVTMNFFIICNMKLETILLTFILVLSS